MKHNESRPAASRRETGISERVGAAIRLTRIERRLKQVQLARRLGISQQLLWKLETGKTPISIERLVRILECLGVTPTQFLGRLEEAGKCRDQLFKRGACRALADGLVADFLAVESVEARGHIRALIKTIGKGGAEGEVQHHDHLSGRKARAT